MSISFIYNSSKKAKSHYLIALLPVFRLFCFYIWRHSPCFDAIGPIRNTDGWIIRFDDLKMISIIQFPHQSWNVNTKTENISLRIQRSVYMYNWIFKTRLTFAVTLNVKKITNTISIFHIKFKSERAYTQLFMLKLLILLWNSVLFRVKSRGNGSNMWSVSHVEGVY